MPQWRYFQHFCKTCEKEGEVRADVHYRLLRLGKDWECRPCSSGKRARERMTKHGYYGTSTYVSWQKMKDRCLNKNHKYFNLYGGRGIKIDPKWMSFKGFLEDMGEMPKEGYSLDRVDNDLGYCVENCRWIPKNDYQHGYFG